MPLFFMSVNVFGVQLFLSYDKLEHLNYMLLRKTMSFLKFKRRKFEDCIVEYCLVERLNSVGPQLGGGAIF